ncbi:hypothetical protein CBA19CS22_00625 [Caballeronia novacaledonica]|uniref:Uncharacterized protein n=1 Tax=Caballeronia novacaledonica TaxID=1544861 RepID=A0ACB5QJX3_9BURK|nr:hypothetical protein CBA19CS22_00625 [Caballeronia novacaledonica]
MIAAASLATPNADAAGIVFVFVWTALSILAAAVYSRVEVHQ